MTEVEIHRVIFEILHRIAPEADLDGLDPKQNLREALDIDSFDFLNALVAISEEFHVNIPESDYRQIGTLDALVRYLSTRAA